MVSAAQSPWWNPFDWFTDDAPKERLTVHQVEVAKLQHRVKVAEWDWTKARRSAAAAETLFSKLKGFVRDGKQARLLQVQLELPQRFHEYEALRERKKEIDRLLAVPANRL